MTPKNWYNNQIHRLFSIENKGKRKLFNSKVDRSAWTWELISVQQIYTLILTYERLYPKWSTSYPQRWKKSRAYIFHCNTPPILMPKWPYWWGFLNGTPFEQIWYYYDGANKDLVPKKAKKHQIFGVVKLDTQCLGPFCNTI